MSKRNTREAKRVRREERNGEQKKKDELFSVDWKQKKKESLELISQILCQTRSLEKLPEKVVNQINVYHDLIPEHLRNRVSWIDLAQNIVEMDCFGALQSWGWETKEDSDARTDEGWSLFVRDQNPVDRPTVLETVKGIWDKNPSLREKMRKQPRYEWQSA